jgi:hypothetical protein
MKNLNLRQGSHRKTLRYPRWGIRLVFLLILVDSIKFFTDTARAGPVYSLSYGVFSQPLFTVPYGESVCSFLLLRWTCVGLGAWAVCPLGGSEVLARAPLVGGCLFLSMYPVLYAKETLTEKEIRERRLKEYAERLGKTIQETEEN